MKTILTVEESQRLIDLGVDPKLAHDSVLTNEYNEQSENFRHPIFSLADLLSILPKEIIADTIMGKDFPCALTIRWDENRKVWNCAYECLPLPLNVGESSELIDALNTLLIWCLEQKIIKLNKTDMKELKITATTEQEFREQAYEIAKSVNTAEELAEFVNFISNTPLDYGTAVYAQCAAMLAAQHVINNGEQGGITGFQAGFIGWEMVKQFMIVGDCGLSIVDWENMLYPQYEERFEKTIPRKIFERLQEKAREMLAKDDKDKSINGHSLHPEVRNHMKSIVNGVVPFGYVIKED